MKPVALKSEAAAFTAGSIMRHVVVMTATGSVGLMAIFVVDFLNLFYISRLGQQELAAAIGYAGTLQFFLVSIAIGITIAGTALVARALGGGRRDDARRLAASSLAFMLVVMSVVSFAVMPFLDQILTVFGATGRTKDIAYGFLLIVMPSMPLMGIGIGFSGILRAVGDARRSMYVTLGGAIATAALDPILIFGLHWGVTGAAIVSVISRLVLVGIGFHGAVKVHNLVARPRLADAIADSRALAGIAVPAVLTNIATPVGNAWITAAIAAFGDSAVAGWAVVGRLMPLAFAGIFALTGAVGGILGQNLGAKRYDRVQRTITDCLIFTLVYTLVAWAVLALLAGPIARAFDLTGFGAELLVFFCYIVAGSYLFHGAMFVANTAFNNLGYPVMSTVFNWGRATLGTFPFVWIGAKLAGANGVLAGQGAGAVVFGTLSVIACYRVVVRLSDRDSAPAPASSPATASAVVEKVEA